jgi:hypothetical protein
MVVALPRRRDAAVSASQHTAKDPSAVTSRENSCSPSEIGGVTDAESKSNVRKENTIARVSVTIRAVAVTVAENRHPPDSAVASCNAAPRAQTTDVEMAVDTGQSRIVAAESAAAH